MGKYKFRLSGMIPNAWFYKLKDMSSNRSKHNSSQSQSTSKKKPNSTTISLQKPHVMQPFHFTEFIPDSTKFHGFHNSPFNQNFSGTHFPEPARKSSKRRSRRRTIYKPSPRVVVNPVSATCICHVSPNSFGTMPRSPDSIFSSIECSPRPETYEYSLSEAENANTFSSDSFDDLASWSSSNVVARKSSASSISVKLRMNSPRIGRRTQAHVRRNVPSSIRLKSKNNCLMESVAMVKTSHNPREDFRESMVEMIIENNIRSSKDLEDLLACYLILNSDEYHDLIIKTFEQIWFDMAELQI